MLETSKLRKWLWIIACRWLLSICIFGVATLGTWNLVDYWRSADWIQAVGTIICLEIADYGGSEPSPRWSSRGKLSCTYEYSVNGQSYVGSKIGVETFGESRTRARRYRELKADLAEAKPITVFVDPNAPARSALFRETLSEMYFGPALGLFWLCALMFSGRRNSTRRKVPK